jgi:hypothetical protein
MEQLRGSRWLAAVLAIALLQAILPCATLAQVGPPTPLAKSSPAALDRARELIKDGEYDGAIEILKGAIGAGQSVQLRDAYLLLIKTYVFLGNDLKFKPQGREASNLNYQEAKKLIAECLRAPGLRHTEPVPATDYPPEMIESFRQVRATIFGSFHIARLEPPATIALLDSDTLRAFPGDTLPGDVDIPVGQHLVHVRAPGYKHVDEEVVIPPGSVLERSYRLTRKRGAAWYATASSVAVAAVIGAFAIGRGSSGGPSTPGVLPGAPPPPSGAR